MTQVRQMTRHNEPQEPPLARPRRRQLVLSVSFIVLQSMSLLLPSLVDGEKIPLVAFIVSTASTVVLLALNGVEWALHLRERSGITTRLAAGASLAALLGAACGALCVAAEQAGLLSALIHRFGSVYPATQHATAAGVISGAASGLFALSLWALAVVIPGAAERERARWAEISTLKSEAERLRSEAELARLRGQLEPHFLLNTLNLIAGLVGTDTERARAVLVSLGDLLRDTLSDHSDLQTVEEEIRWLRRYVEVLEARHGALLQVDWRVDSGAQDGLVPRLILQPLVENAICHGALRRKGGGKILVQVRRAGTLIECEIADDGPGLGKARDGGIGLGNVKRRIALHFPGGALNLESDQSGGTRAIVRIPYTVATHDRSMD